MSCNLTSQDCALPKLAGIPARVATDSGAAVYWCGLLQRIAMLFVVFACWPVKPRLALAALCDFRGASLRDKISSGRRQPCPDWHMPC
jgi:hypothetical protein